MLLWNPSVLRDLVEGDEVVVQSGPRAGQGGVVIGFSLTSPRPVIVQYPRTRGITREAFAASEVNVTSCVIPRESLEPLPEPRCLLAEMKSGTWETVGNVLRVRGPKHTFDLVPVGKPIKFSALRESKDHQDDVVLELLRTCFLTRRPHLVSR